MSAYDKHIEWAKKELQKLETSKQTIIQDLAKKLEDDGMKASEISGYISDKLSEEGFTTKRYVREVLSKIEDGEKYKEKKKDTSKQQEEPEKQQVLQIATTGEAINQNPSQSAASTPQHTAPTQPEIEKQLVRMRSLLEKKDAELDAKQALISELKERVVLPSEQEALREEIAKKDKQIADMEEELNQPDEKLIEEGDVVIDAGPKSRDMRQLREAVKMWQEGRASKYFILEFKRKGKDLMYSNLRLQKS